MEIVYYLSAASLVAFMIFATYDGVYLHLWKFELFRRKESRFEHKMHTIRAILFPVIVWLLFLNSDLFSFWLGITFVLADLIVLGIDAFSEKESRKFMGGLPRWEYIIHLFANGFHFASIFLMISARLSIHYPKSATGELLVDNFAQELMGIVAQNALPGAIILALVHIVLITKFGQVRWMNLRSKVKCC